MYENNKEKNIKIVKDYNVIGKNNTNNKIKSKNSSVEKHNYSPKKSILESPNLKGRSYAKEKEREKEEFEKKKNRTLLKESVEKGRCEKYTHSIEKTEKMNRNKLVSIFTNKNKPISTINTTSEANNNIKIPKIIRKKKHSLPKNVNEYKHLLKKSNLVGADIEWVLDLREKSKIDYNELIKKVKEAPSFYDEDFNNYKNKLEKENKKIMSNTQNCFNKLKLNEAVDYKDNTNMNQTSHLFKPRPTVDKNIINFEVNLRDYRIKEDKSKMNKTGNSWISIGYKTSPNFIENKKTPIQGNIAKNMMNNTNAFLIKPFKYKIEKMDIPIDYSKNIISNSEHTGKNENSGNVDYEKNYKFNTTNKFFRKRLTYDKDSLEPYLGEHKSLPHFISANSKDPLASTYNGINLGTVNHLLQNKAHFESNNLNEILNRNSGSKNEISHSNVLWQLNLRGELNKRAASSKKYYDHEYLIKKREESRIKREKNKDEANKYYNTYFKK